MRWLISMDDGRWHAYPDFEVARHYPRACCGRATRATRVLVTGAASRCEACAVIPMMLPAGAGTPTPAPAGSLAGGDR
ncbi:hypothetical protein SAMN06265360_1593 [Haloechinothrix alba]|uniref:Uncharacterized protein n=1 Tax=Haloechinothrix alba TaxID=664784 RepID=A0A239AT78_9PSEU|nr:hypothetical protein [Haloechinothrix alba]SNR98905.1 hypothetical protein SAMN06265360_1593 [Haloechinothrix alba]